MPRKNYFGPAGIFSTDNPVADQAQIEAEQYEPEEEEETEQEPDPECTPLVEAFVGSIGCTWWNHELIEEPAFDEWIEKMKAEHKEKCGCRAELLFSHD